MTASPFKNSCPKRMNRSLVSSQMVMEVSIIQPAESVRQNKPAAMVANDRPFIAAGHVEGLVINNLLKSIRLSAILKFP